GANDTISHVNTQLERVDGITSNAQTVSSNVSVLSSVFTTTLGSPLVKTAAASYGISKAVRARRRSKASGGENGKHALRRKGRRCSGSFGSASVWPPASPRLVRPRKPLVKPRLRG